MIKVYQVEIKEMIYYPKCRGCKDDLKENAVLFERDDKDKLEIYCTQCYVNLVIEEDLGDYLEKLYEENEV